MKTLNDTMPTWQKIFHLSDELRDYASEKFNDHEFLKDMTLNQVRIMTRTGRLLMLNPEGISLKQLAAKLRLSPAATSEMVDTLVRKNVLSRETSSYDRRAIAIKMSAESEVFLKKRADFFSNLFQELLEDISEEDQEKLNVLLSLLLQKLLGNQEAEN